MQELPFWLETSIAGFSVAIGSFLSLIYSIGFVAKFVASCLIAALYLRVRRTHTVVGY